jgi:hypothetical protein
MQQMGMCMGGGSMMGMSNRARSIPEISSLILFMAEGVTLISSSPLFS